MNPRRWALLLCFLLPGPAFASPLSFAVGLDTGGALLESAVPSLAPKPQAVADGRLSGTFLLGDALGLGAALLLSNAWPSDVSGGYQLRGYGELGLSAYLELAWASAPGGGGTLRVGGQAGMSGSIATYQPTGLSFFVPSVDLMAFASATVPGLPYLDLRAGLPVRVLLRRDMSWSVAAGLSVGAVFVFGRPAAGGRARR